MLLELKDETIKTMEEYTFEMRVKDNMNALIDRYDAFGAWMVARKNRAAHAEGTSMYELYKAVEAKLYKHLQDTQNTEYMGYVAMCQAMGGQS